MSIFNVSSLLCLAYWFVSPKQLSSSRKHPSLKAYRLYDCTAAHPSADSCEFLASGAEVSKDSSRWLVNSPHPFQTEDSVAILPAPTG